MRHRKADKKLNRSYSLRKALLRDITRSVILYQSIKTTEAKAKEARKSVDRLISLGKKGDLYSRRKAFKELCSHRIVGVLFNEIAPRFLKINGGYTKVLSWTNRRGDNAKMAILELTMKEKKEKTKKVSSSEEEVKKVVTQEKESVKQKSQPLPKEKTSIKKEKPQDEKISPPSKEKPKEKKPAKKFFNGLRERLFKRERDSL